MPVCVIVSLVYLCFDHPSLHILFGLTIVTYSNFIFHYSVIENKLVYRLRQTQNVDKSARKNISTIQRPFKLLMYTAFEISSTFAPEE